MKNPIFNKGYYLSNGETDEFFLFISVIGDNIMYIDFSIVKGMFFPRLTDVKELERIRNFTIEILL